LLQQWHYFYKNKLGITGLVVILVLILAAILAPYITTSGYAEQKYLQEINGFPSSSNWFGIDAVGRDYFSRVIYGIRVSFFVGFAAALVALFVGVPLGALAGYYQGVFDWIVLRLLEIFSIIPSLLVAILFITILGSGIQNIIYIVGMFSWMNICRLVRGEIIALKERDYCIAAKVSGAKPLRILFRHLLPNATGSIIVGLVLCIPRAIMMEAMLSFIGIGVNPPMPSWGQMIREGLYYIQFYWHLLLFPSLFLIISVLSLTFIGDAIRDTLDPKLRGMRL